MGTKDQNMKYHYKRMVKRNHIRYGNIDVVGVTISYNGQIWNGPFNISDSRIIKEEKSDRFESDGEYSLYLHELIYNNKLNVFDRTGIFSQH